MSDKEITEAVLSQTVVEGAKMIVQLEVELEKVRQELQNQVDERFKKQQQLAEANAETQMYRQKIDSMVSSDKYSSVLEQLADSREIMASLNISI
jgi:hypothetical protein